MKSILKHIFFLGLIICFAFPSFAQQFDGVSSAIKIGSSKDLSAFFDNNVEITIDGKTSNYSKSQSEFVVKDFFKNNPPKGFNVIHSGSSEGGLQYAIGKYEGVNSAYRILVRMKDNKIYNLSFTKD